ncbi:glutamyl-Q tRNA(Asp) synthetase [Maricaulis sp. W15]|uniref:tRNA glutamyl-Q(34) synthetase GluQRS n=1 Tax=Maricaulis sp. W15 TaxID=1772333 RepID=UPI000948F183|nr:tRNA glutamyl-Q(34) synthetase GluQRS [Maricaulis sp. W15]OLF71833.1 glutamyl-Q tRNA(Asp) synthetase [Maricaulis sp. W15]
MTFTTRFAPSPTGHLHIGHAFSAWTAFRAACEAEGRFILRMEDIDTVRCKRKFEQVILDDLIWLGLDWEEPVRRQSEHFSEYDAVLERLRGLGVVYRCFKTRREIMEDIARAPHEVGEVYRGPLKPMSADEEAARVDAGEAFAWRLSQSHCRDVLGARFGEMRFIEDDKGEQTADPAPLGDVVLARKDVGTSYHIAAVHDDALQGISHVIRGEDLRAMTPLHVLLQTLLGLPTPVYRHHRLLLDETGERFAKRNRSATLKSLRESGVSPDQVRARFSD